MSNENPNIGKSIKAGKYMVNYHDVGEGDVVFLIHGSGPGVTAYANWGKVMPLLKKNKRVIAPDMLGFGYSERPEGIKYTMDLWVQQTIDLMDALEVDQADIVGNSFGGALALSLAIKYPERVRKIVLMGSMGIEFNLTYGLDRVWGYEASVEFMRSVLDLFTYNKEMITDELAKIRYSASVEPGFQESFSSMFPYPRQSSVTMMASDEDDIKKIKAPALIVHGRDDLVIPVSNAYKLFDLLEDSQLHIFGKCGHWTQIEHTGEFCRLIDGFLAE